MVQNEERVSTVDELKRARLTGGLAGAKTEVASQLGKLAREVNIG